MGRLVAVALLLVGASVTAASCDSSPQSASSQAPVPKPIAPAPSAPKASSTKPSEVAIDLRSLMTPVKAQGERDACTFFALTAHLEATLKRELGRDVDLSEELVIHATKAAGKDADRETANMTDVGATLLQSGLLLEQDWAYQPAWFTRGFPECGFDFADRKAPSKCYAHNPPPAAVLSRTLATRLAGGVFIPGMRGATEAVRDTAFEALFSHLAAKSSVIFSFPHPKDNTGWPKSGDLYWDDALDAKYGDGDNHFALLSGYDPATRLFTFKNSWGTGWGHEGYGTIAYDVLRKYGQPLYVFRLKVVPFDPPAPKRPEATSLSATAKRVSAKGVVVSVTGEVSGIAGRFVMAQAELVRQPKSSNATDLSDVSEIAFTDDERAKFHASTPSAVWNHVPSDEDALRWTNAAPLRLELPNDLLQTKSVAAALASKADRLVARTTLFVFTDDAGFKPLARTHTLVK